MPDMIKDGQGRGFLAGVNKDNQLVTRSTVINQHTKSAIDGNYYEVSSDMVTLTDAAENYIIYIKNDADEDFIIIDKVFVDCWESTGGTGGGILKYYKNPTVTGGTSLYAINTNFANVLKINGDLLSPTTMVGYTWWNGYIAPGSSNTIDEEKITLPPGYGFGISYQPPIGNTSMVININIAFYNFDTDLL